MKCPLCDGTVVNGRCKECGMPYRNDEVLYHLNESRSDHYRHASDKARRIMQAQQRAGNAAKSVGAGAKRTGSQAKAGTGKNDTGGRTITRQTFKEQQKQIRQEAMRKMTDTGNTTATARRTVQKSWSTTGDKEKKPKKRSKLGILWVLIIILGAVAPMADDLVDVVKEAVHSEFEDSGSDAVQTDTSVKSDWDTYFYSWDDDDGYKYYAISAGFGQAEAGDDFEAGEYGIFTSSKEVTLTVTRKSADNEKYTLKEGEDTIFLTFEEGDCIQIESANSDYDGIYLMEWEE